MAFLYDLAVTRVRSFRVSRAWWWKTRTTSMRTALPHPPRELACMLALLWTMSEYDNVDFDYRTISPAESLCLSMNDHTRGLNGSRLLLE